MTRYDKRYFDKWYRSHRVSTPAETTRKAALVLALAEYYLGRPVRTVLDIGCGEGQWKTILERLRPGIRYEGLDASEYAVGRHGRARNIRLAAFAQLPELRLRPRYDLIVCSNLLFYLDREELNLGMPALAAHLGGVAFLEAYAGNENLHGDVDGIRPHSAAFYRRLFRRHGLVSCGSHCYVGAELADRVTPLERGA